MIKTPNEVELIFMNAYLIKKDSPAETIGVKDASALNMCVRSVHQSVFDEDLYPTVEDKASILYINLIKKHCFHNGNKRTATMAMNYVLKINGLEWIMNHDDTVELAVKIATWNNSDFDSLKDYVVQTIKENTKKQQK